MKFRYLPLTLVLALLAVACVYDYEPTVMESASMLVVNGDILIGEETTVRLTYASKIGAKPMGNQLADLVYVEASDGVTYAGVPAKDKSYHIDTRMASPSAEYRLVIEQRGKVYESDWAPVLESPAIDSISFSIDEGGKTMTIDVSTHADAGAAAGNRYFRWLGRQVWEYHSATRLIENMIPAGATYKGVVVPRDTTVYWKYGDIDNYFCWTSAEVPDLMLGKTEDLKENRLVRHALYQLDNQGTRSQYLYSIELVQEAITGEAWRYYEAVRRNSTDVGGLFSAQPSEVRGNIHNRDDAGEWVLGYVSVTRPAVLRRFIDMRKLMFHRYSDWDRVIEYVVTPEFFLRYYQNGYRLSHMDFDPVKYYWMPRGCYDCTAHGGNKNKPEWWPNDDL